MRRLAFVAGGSVEDRKAWSGTTYYAHRALAARFDVTVIEAPKTRWVLRGLRKAMRPVGFDPIREPSCGTVFAAQMSRQIERTGAEAVFALGASHLSAGLADHHSVFHCSDATFARMIGYHSEFSTLSRRTLKAGDMVERRAIHRSRAVILASEWAAESVRQDYQRSSGVHIVPFGANLDTLPAADTWSRRPECSLVFVGVNWFAKGADVAVETARILNARSIPTTLHIVGCQPPAEFQALPFVKLHGFLRKQVPAEYAQLTRLIADASFLILPTRFEAFGIVSCEAAAHGTPAIARNTGGVSAVIRDDVTGLLLPDSAEGAAYADRVEQVWCNPDRYLQMRRQALARSRTVLNWQVWGEQVHSIISQTLDAERSADHAKSVKAS